VFSTCAGDKRSSKASSKAMAAVKWQQYASRKSNGSSKVVGHLCIDGLRKCSQHVRVAREVVKLVVKQWQQ
jgi:hypothetical protein